MGKSHGVSMQAGEANFHQDKTREKKRRRKPLSSYIGRILLVILILVVRYGVSLRFGGATYDILVLERWLSVGCIQSGGCAVILPVV